MLPFCLFCFSLWVLPAKQSKLASQLSWRTVWHCPLKDTSSFPQSSPLWSSPWSLSTFIPSREHSGEKQVWARDPLCILSKHLFSRISPTFWVLRGAGIQTSLPLVTLINSSSGSTQELGSEYHFRNGIAWHHPTTTNPSVRGAKTSQLFTDVSPPAGLRRPALALHLCIIYYSALSITHLPMTRVLTSLFPQSISKPQQLQGSHLL